MSIGIDLGLVAAEVVLVIAAGTSLFDRIRKHASIIVWITLILSQFLNCLAFCERTNAEPYHIALGIMFGIVLPLLVYLLTRIAASLWVSRNNFV